MGVNNRKRRAAKQRKRARQRSSTPSALGQPAPSDPFGAAEWDAVAAYGLVELHLAAAVRRLGGGKLGDAKVLDSAMTSLLRRIRPAPRFLLQEMLTDQLVAQLRAVTAGGWGEQDLTELVRRCVGATHLPALTALQDGRIPGLDTDEGLASGLQLAALFAVTPLLDAEQIAGATAGESATEHPKLAQVRALLAKAESTDHDEEAEALSAKAQELITKYALDRLVEQVGSHDRSNSNGFQVRRLWIDAPYVGAKAALVHQVARANRCRAAVAERFGFSLVLGSAADLDAVELLVTSLLVQADAAMLRHGRRYDESGVPRTRSFRRSFLMAYAFRIGERLREAEAATIATEDDGRLLPVLRDHQLQVDEVFNATVPHTESKAATVSNGDGWYAGLAAADQALLDVRGKLPSEHAG